MGAQGTAILDFEDGFPESVFDNETTVGVTGQTAILATSHVEAFFMEETTADNGADEHREAAALCPLVIENVQAGVGFTIRGMPLAAIAVGTFKVRWVWN